MRTSNNHTPLFSVIVFALAIPLCVGGFLAKPYVDFINWRGSMVRPYAAHMVFVLEGIAIALLLMGCALALSDKARRRSRTGCTHRAWRRGHGDRGRAAYRLCPKADPAAAAAAAAAAPRLACELFAVRQMEIRSGLHHRYPTRRNISGV